MRRQLIGHAVHVSTFTATLAAAAALLDVELFAQPHVKSFTLFVLVAGTVSHLLNLVGLTSWARLDHDT